MSDSKTVVIPLKGKNYASWKIQCRMSLIKDSLWSIVTGTEVAPVDNAELARKFKARSDRALATSSAFIFDGAFLLQLSLFVKESFRNKFPLWNALRLSLKCCYKHIVTVRQTSK